MPDQGAREPQDADHSAGAADSGSHGEPPLEARGDRVFSGGPWEDAYGYARAAAAGDFVFVSGCTAVGDRGVAAEGDPYQQSRLALDAAETALTAFGIGLRDVVRTRIYLTHAGDADEVGRAHAEVFGAVRPAATMVVVSGLIDPRMLVEIEVEAYRGGAR